MTAFLPHREPSLRRMYRKWRLIWSRRQYQYDYTHLSPLAILKKLPITDEFSFHWLKTVGERVLDVLNNRAQLELTEHHRKKHRERFKVIRELIDIGDTAIGDLHLHVTEILHFVGRLGAPANPGNSLTDFGDLFRSFGIPPISKDFADDRAFADKRVAGPNPVMLQRLKKLDERLPVTNAIFQTAVPQDSLDAALAEGRLYLADYALLDGAELGTFPNGQKYLYAPLALFVVMKGSKELLPVAIQCQQQPGVDVPIFTPGDGYNWLIAKTIVETADGNIHEASTHLGRTHLIMEAFVISSYRNLDAVHPIALLLWPHFEGTLAINKDSWHHLIADKGCVDKLFGGTIQTSRSVVVGSVQSTRVMNDLLPLTFARRGVDDCEALPNYPYRDDAILYWDAIHEWVCAYLDLYYPHDVEVQSDTELQAWIRELASDRGGRIKGLPNGGAIRRISELAEIVTFVIYTCSVQHAAVNFPQFDCMSYVPNMPLAGYRPVPKTKTGATEADFIATLPTLDMAELQLELGYLLGTVHYTQLGQYPRHQFRDHRVAAPLQHFQNRLTAIGTTIAERNQSRRPYETLAPAGIPQSINI